MYPGLHSPQPQSLMTQPTPPTALSNYTLVVTGAEANLIGAALGKLPYENVAELLGKIRQQAQMQEMQANAQAAPQAKAEQVVAPGGVEVPPSADQTGNPVVQ